MAPPLPVPAGPHLPVGEEVVLLSLRSPSRRLRRAVALAARLHGQPRNYRTALKALQARRLLTRSRLLGKPGPTAKANVEERCRRVLVVIRDPAIPAPRDLELLALLAFCGALQLSDGDRLRARHRIAAVGDDDKARPLVDLLCDELNVTSPTELADALFPPRTDFHIGNFDPGITLGT
jgi:hypothetical protein